LRSRRRCRRDPQGARQGTGPARPPRRAASVDTARRGGRRRSRVAPPGPAARCARSRLGPSVVPGPGGDGMSATSFTIRVYDGARGPADYQLSWLPEELLRELADQVNAELVDRAGIRQQFNQEKDPRLLLDAIHGRAGEVKALMSAIRRDQRALMILTGRLE